MLNPKMTLTEMAHFEPNEEDMLSLPLTAVTYLKVSLVSLSMEDNYGFINFFFKDKEVEDYINDIPSTVVYDFDATKTNQEKFVTIFELTGKANFHEISMYLEELLNNYSHEADVIIDIFTHDSKKYRLSNLEGIVKLEELHG
ncbi:MAG: hypothetical protein Q4F12_02330 [Erysipelotrichaceae bacterium]|nr:hypothetical protein [Erysipelotrichaceae bacterium]